MRSYKILFFCCIFGLIILVNTIIAYEKPDAKKILDKYYSSVTGFGISIEDQNNITKHGGCPTYGEITEESTAQLIDYLKPKSTDVFVDAGSGIGKVALQFLISSDINKSIGIELSNERHKKAADILETLKKNNEIPQGKILEFYNQDILDADLSQTTIFFMCSTCFSLDLMKKITDKLAKLKPGMRVITLKQLPANENFKLIHQMDLAMTWSPSSLVYIYELIHN